MPNMESVLQYLDSDFAPSPDLPEDGISSADERIPKRRETCTVANTTTLKKRKTSSAKGKLPATSLIPTMPSSPPVSPVSGLGVLLSVRHSREEGTIDDV
ncbi:hypothetical protein ON010_g14092 [Phytophthora cinnamomi]|nr:hypothetical protein ON010_g14092 [Phytophthora cinnamomi]